MAANSASALRQAVVNPTTPSSAAPVRASPTAVAPVSSTSSPPISQQPSRPTTAAIAAAAPAKRVSRNPGVGLIGASNATGSDDDDDDDDDDDEYSNLEDIRQLPQSPAISARWDDEEVDFSDAPSSPARKRLRTFPISTGGGGSGGDGISQEERASLLAKPARMPMGVYTKPDLGRQTMGKPLGPSEYLQNIIVQKYLVHHDQFRARSRVPPKDQLCPIGSPVDHRILQRELVYTIVPEDGLSGPGTHRFRNIHRPGDFVFSCLNGLPRGTRIAFAGQAMTNAQVDLKEPDTITVQIASICHAWHTGNVTIQRGQWVMFTELPINIMNLPGPDGVTKIPGPRVLEPNVSPTKIRPALLPYTTDQFLATDKEMCQVIDSALLGITDPFSDYKSAWNTLRCAVDTFCIGRALEGVVPFHMIGYWEAIKRLHRRINFHVTAILLSNNTNSVDGTLVTTYQSIIQPILETFSEILEREADVYKVPMSIQYSLNVSEHLVNRLPINQQQQAYHWNVILPDFIDSHYKLALQSHRAWESRSVLGKAMSSAEPGHGVDILLGMGKWG